jgi:hypothetical protein
VNLDIANLSTDDKDVMILVDSSGEAGLSPRKPVRIAAVSESGGNKFGVWGLVEDDAKLPDEIDRDLLTIDAALLLGEIKASSSKRAGMRFTPLREGSLSIPNFKLIDRRRGKWYSAVHNLRLVVDARPDK